VESPSVEEIKKQSLMFKVSAHAQQYYEDAIRPRERECFNGVEMEGITEKDLEAILLDCSERYEQAMCDEIEKATCIIDHNNTIKTREISKSLNKKLI